VLAALGWERQLVSHLLGATRMGCARADVTAALDAAARIAGAPGRAVARRARSVAFASS